MKKDNTDKCKEVLFALLTMVVVEVGRRFLIKGLDAVDRRRSTNNKKTGDVS